MTALAAREMSGIASELLATLNGDQRRTAQWPFPSYEERLRWFYTPTDHGGVTLHSLAPAQTRLMMRLIGSALSPAAYVTVSTIMGLENVLDHLERWVASWGHPRGRDPQRYYWRVFGNPGSDEWGWRLGGHHVSINITVRGGEVLSSTPCFLGADPARATLLGGHLLAPLAACEDIARDLLESFDESQRSTAIVSDVPPVDLVGANRAVLNDGDRPLRLAKVWRDEFTGELKDLVEKIQDDEEAKIGLGSPHLESVEWTTVPKGLPAALMNEPQRSVLRDLLATYLDRARDDVAEAEWSRVNATFDDLHFAWAGPVERNRPHYYRVQGPRLLAEYDNTTRDGNHVHTVWRDPVNDFGGDALGVHRRVGH